MTPISDVQCPQSEAHLTAVLWTPELGWLDTKDTYRLDARVTAEQKLARLAEALKDFPKLAARSVELGERMVELAELLVEIAERKHRILDEQDFGKIRAVGQPRDRLPPQPS